MVRRWGQLMLILTWLLFAASLAAAQPLVPAGSINAAFSHDRIIFIVEDDAAVRKYATAIRDKFFPDASIMSDMRARSANLRGANLIVYATPRNSWLNTYKDRLPVRYGKNVVFVQSRRYEGRQLRVICSIKNPDDLERTAVLYTASQPEYLIDINELFHGATEWLVANGDQTLAQGNYTVHQSLSIIDMESDFADLVRRVRTIHPATVEGIPPEVDRAIEGAKGQMEAPLTRAQFWQVSNNVLLSLHDAHTSMSSLGAGDRIALPFAWLEDGMIVDQDTALLRVGDRIVAVGDHDPAQLLSALRGFIPAENDGWVRHRGQSVLTDVSMLRVLGIADESPVSVVVERDGELVQLSVAAQSKSPPRRTQPWVRFEVDPDENLAVFTLDRCTNDENYRRTLREFFDAVHTAGVGRIAVDVRHNSGGNSSVLTEFLRYVDVERYHDYTGEVRWSAESLRQRRKEGPLEYIRYDPQLRENERVEDPPAYAGEIFVLTSNATFSSGAWFAVVLQDNGLGEVLGESTGAAPSAYGDILNLTLPHSGYSYTMSFKKWVRPDPGRDPARSLEPDRHIPRTRQDLLDGVDPVLAYLLGQ